MKPRSPLHLLAACYLLLATPLFAADPAPGTDKTVALDTFYNHQLDKTGQPYHYIWSDTKNTGFSKFGKVLTDDGAQITTLPNAPSDADLSKASIYIICCPTP